MTLDLDIAEDELQTVLAEADEQIQILDEGLVRLEQAGSDPQLLQAIFRAAHTLKGTAGMINHGRMADLTHAMETVLDGLRKGSLTITTAMVDACLESLDALKLLRDEIAEGAVNSVNIAPLATRLSVFSQPASPDSLPTFICADIAASSVAPAARALQVVLALQSLGLVSNLQPLQSVIETAAPVRRVTAHLSTTWPVAHVRQALTSISEIARLTIGEEEIVLIPDETAAAAEPADEETGRLGEFLLKAGYITPDQLQAAIQQQSADPGRKELLGQTLVKLGALTQDALDRASAQQVQQLRAALQAAQRAPEPARLHPAEKTVRTSVERLDNLMNLVGELITDRNRLNQLRDVFSNRFHNGDHALAEDLAQTVIHLGRITDQLQDEVMHIRMLPIANVFGKLPRLIRDLARKAGKQVELVIRGEDTELDRSVIEEIGDPLIHLLRNAVDHGIEPPDGRLAYGKSERGVVLLTARHEESHIVLTVEDDGRGIDVERVKATAMQKGIITETEAAVLTREESLELIFQPGLSTAAAVNDVSGRGVGMDIVRTNIERLNGSITVETWPGQGTRFQIMLPLTLAIIPTMLVQVTDRRPNTGSSTFAVPLVAVMETLRLSRADLHTVKGRPVTHLRGRVLPLVRLSEILEIPPSETPRHAAYEYVVAVRWGKLELGLMVDTLIGEQELVVKPLGALMGDTPGISGAAILGDGQVALIVDVPGLIKLTGV